MKLFLILICTLGLSASGRSAPADQGNRAVRQQIADELGLSGKERKAFEPIYKAYREELDRATGTPAEGFGGGDEGARQRALTSRLEQIAATARVKRDYVDRFAGILTAEQIRRLYNAEGAIGTNLRGPAPNRRNAPSRLRGSGRMVTQDWGAAGAYTALSAGSFFKITVSPTARSISVTADDNVIDYLTLERRDGALGFGIDLGRGSSTQNISVSVVVPASASLREIRAGSYGEVVCKMPLQSDDVVVSVSSYGSVRADIASPGSVRLHVSSYGKFTGSVNCSECVADLSSYGSLRGDLECAQRAEVKVGSYAAFTGDIRAGQTGPGGAGSAVTPGSGEAALYVGSYAKFSGSICSPQLSVRVSSGGSVTGEFHGTKFDAEISSYGKLTFENAAEVDSGEVVVSSGAAFRATDLRVKSYSVTASGYSRADLWCSELLKIRASTQAKVTYDGPCRIESYTENVRRRK